MTQQPPQGQPGDPYGPSQPPAGGYAPGQVGPEYGQAPQYTQPDPNQPGYNQPGYPGQGGYAPQPGYGQQPGQDPYGHGQYGPPPVQPTSKGSAGTIALVVIVLVLMAFGGVAGFVFLGDSEEGTTNAGGGEETTSAPDKSEEPTEEEPSEEPTGGSEPSGDFLPVDSLSAMTPLPGDPWVYAGGPGEATDLQADATVYTIQHTDNWISYFSVGALSTPYVTYDPSDMESAAEDAMEVWISGAFSSGSGVEAEAVTFTDTEVDGHTALLAESRVSWDSHDGTDDTYEDVAMLIVDVDGVNAFLGIASVPESGTDARQQAIDALTSTVFDAEAA